MNGIEYINENLWAGYLGHGLVILSFVAALVSAVAYAASGKVESELNSGRGWLNMGRTAYIVHGLSVWGVIGLIFYMMLGRFYAYEYVWGHVSNDLPFRYVFSAFWEGQEGSFLLWSFWNVVLGFILMRTAGKKWEAPVMFVFAFVQLILMSMLFGFYITEADGRVGSSPFALMRDTTFAPAFDMPNYVQMLAGKGLNPLLQNYWMTIHPPTLFLGFASTLVPFAYAIAGLWRREHSEWLRPALTWSLFSASILGTGIFMGGVWAYEALSFGGYWAWDPVENASLVPWITLIAGIHTALIARNTGHAVKSTYFFWLLTFFMIVYSTFLTRSGILGETSVHSFTEMGLEWQLVIFLGATAALALGFYFANSRSIPAEGKEESAYSKEFWMFIGALVLLFSAGLITFTTSIPVFNKIIAAVGIDSKIAPPEDVVEHHNRYQLWIGVLIAILSAVAQFMRYKATNMGENTRKFFLRHVLFAWVLTLGLTIPFMLFSGIVAWQYWLLVGTGIFTCVANFDYIITVLRGKIMVSGSAVAHIGFGLLMVGAVWSGALKEPISEGFTSIDDALGDLNKQTNKSVLLIKGRTEMIRNGYSVMYKSDTVVENSVIYTLLFTRKDKDGNLVESFETYPNVLRTKESEDPRTGEIKYKFAAANPDTKHYLGRDVFTLAVPEWAFQSEEDKAKAKADTAAVWQTHQVAKGDTIKTSLNYLIFNGFDTKPTHPQYTPAPDDIAAAAIMTVVPINNIEGRPDQEMRPIFVIRNSTASDIPALSPEIGLSLRFTRILPAEEKVEIQVLQEKPKQAYVVMQAIIFPLINFVWIGSLMMMLGLTMSVFQRKKQNEISSK
jgi:cytochrome c-type biogenesis protein CcmF